ncbi:hypothetical protein MVEG_07397 [Podila verticillata NRRL 6337]|nr:hypothetical protein MVEG_07397 [Podila verticillata NRRL 6337]
MDWDPSREYDSRTFSDDYNLHGASERSFDHPSVTRDDNFFAQEDLNDDDDYSIENADLIADIVDGKTTQDHRARITRGGHIHAMAHKTDDNSVDSIVRYMLNGLQDPEDYPAGGQNHYKDERYEQGEGEQDEEYGTGSSQTPIRQVRSMPPKSPVVRRTLVPKPEHLPKTRHSGSASSDGIKPSAPRSGLRPPTVRSVPTVLPPPGSAVEKPSDIPKPVFRSALKPPNNIKSKLGRHIQLPKELDDEDIDDALVAQQQQQQQQQQGPKETIVITKSSPQVIQKDEPKLEEIEPPVDGSPVQPITPTMPGPSRFTRITKKTVSPGKKLVTTIPTPLDDDVATKDEEDNKQVWQSVKDLRMMLGRLGLLPLSGTLDASLDSLTASDVEKGGLCEMMGLLTRLGGMHEKQKEVIHQMTDQIIAGETDRGSNLEMEMKLQENTRKLETTQAQIGETEDRNRTLESRIEAQSIEIEELRNENQARRSEGEELGVENEDLRSENENLASELEDLRSENEELRSESESLRDEIEALLTKPKSQDVPANKENDREANWSAIEEHLQRQEEAETLKRSTASRHSTASTHEQGDWRNHILTIEKELQALKSMLSRTSLASLPQDDIEERLNDALLENKRLQTKNKGLTKELLCLHEESAQNDKTKTIQKLKALLRDITTHLGVDNHQQIVPVLADIQMNMEELASMRKFIAKTERIIWESEIAEGSVKVQPGPGQEDMSNSTPASEARDYGSMKPGKTCSQSYESTLQRLREWSELLDVLNHVEFADDVGDTSSTATVKPAMQ